MTTANSTQPPSFDDKVIGIDMSDFDLSVVGREFGISPRFDYAGDELIGGRGNDTIFGQFGDDTMDGGGGSDFMFGGRDDDLMDGDYHDSEGRRGSPAGARKAAFGCDDGDSSDVMFGERGATPCTAATTARSAQSTRTTIGDIYRRMTAISATPASASGTTTATGWRRPRCRRDYPAKTASTPCVCDRYQDTMSGGYHYDLMYGGKGSDIMYGGTDASDSGGDDLDDDVQQRL